MRRRSRRFAPKAIILSGGPESVYDAKGLEAPQEVLCAGRAGARHLLRHADHGRAAGRARSKRPSSSRIRRRAGQADARPRRLLDGLEDNRDAEGRRVLDVWMSHGDRVVGAAAGLQAHRRSSDNAPLAAMADESRRFYGLQFHPEVTHSLQGGEILRRFVREIARMLGRSGRPATSSRTAWRGFARRSAADQRAAGIVRRRGLLGAGGAAASRHRRATHLRVRRSRLAAPGRGRSGDGDVCRAHGRAASFESTPSSAFWRRLAGEADPEKKRKIIGRMFVEVFDEEAAKLKDVKWLAQGTIYPDVIESAGAKTGKAHVIKSHHNVGGLPQHMKLKLLEPLRELFKDEVRKLGLELGLPQGDGASASFPRPRPWRADFGRSSQGARGPAAPRGRDFHRRAAHATICTTRSARRLRCSCRCARWASWAMGGATTM